MQAELPQLGPWLEQRADQLWLPLFGAPADDHPGAAGGARRGPGRRAKTVKPSWARSARGCCCSSGVERGDTEADADATARKIAALRIFPRPAIPWTWRSRTWAAAVWWSASSPWPAPLRKGNRPGFEGAEAPERAKSLYERVAAALAAREIPVATGQFAADMQVDLVNDGPVTFVVTVRNGAVTER